VFTALGAICSGAFLGSPSRAWTGQRPPNGTWPHLDPFHLCTSARCVAPAWFESTACCCACCRVTSGRACLFYMREVEGEREEKGGKYAIGICYGLNSGCAPFRVVTQAPSHHWRWTTSCPTLASAQLRSSCRNTGHPHSFLTQPSFVHNVALLSRLAGASVKSRFCSWCDV
jgi:hypothetical protein